MSFLNTLFLWGLPLVAVPVAVHLLSRRRRDVIHWGAMRFLLESRPRRWRIFRLTDLLLMLIRAALVALLIFALARPLLQTTFIGSVQPHDVIFVIDTSLSTARKLDGQTAFDKICQTADAAIERLGEGDVVRVLATSPRRWIVPVGVPVSVETKGEISERLRQLRPTLATADMMSCIQEALSATPADETLPRRITVITDGQAYGWRAEAAGVWEAIYWKIREMPTKIALNVVTVADAQRTPSNLSVESLTPGRLVTTVGEKITLTALIANRGEVPLDPATVTWGDGTNSLGVTTTAALEPGQTTAVSIEHSFETPGVYEVTCDARCGDDVEMDNRARCVVEVLDRLPLLVVDGHPDARGPMATETAFLVAALGRGKADAWRTWRSAFEPQVISASQLSSVPLSDYACVVLANVARLPDDAMARLKSFVRSGGGLWVTLGDRTDRAHFNQAFFGAGAGVSPIGLAEPVGDANNHDASVPLYIPSLPHKVMTLLADTKRSDLDHARIYRRHRFEGGRRPKGVSILMQTQTGDPLAIERTFGRGRVILQAIPLNVRWSNLPVLQSFVIMAHEYLWYLSEPAMPRRNLQIGEMLVGSFPKGDVGDSAQVHTPQGTTVDAMAALREGKRIFACNDTLTPGSYLLEVASAGGKTRSVPYWVRRDPEESDLQALEAADTKEIATAGGLSFTDDPQAPAAGEGEIIGTEPLWTAVLVSVLGLMVLEGLLAGRITRRRNAATPPIPVRSA